MVLDTVFLIVVTIEKAHYQTGRVFANGTGNGFNLRSSPAKDSKMVIDTSLINTQYY